MFHTVDYGVLSNKDISSYIELLTNIKSYVFSSRENENNSEERLPITMHCDFELALISVIKQVLPETQIKLGLWHFYRNIEIKRKKIYGDILNQNQDSLNIV